MARILAIDYGRKRCGLAVSDPLQIIATGLTTVETDQLIYFIKKYINTEPVSTIILGKPLRLDGTENDLMPKVEKCYRQLNQLFAPINIYWVDERFTSKMATQAIIDSGLKKKDRQNKALVDEVSATILLQGYMATL